MADIDVDKIYSRNSLAYERSKELVIKEYIDFIKGKIKKEFLISSIDTHAIPTKIMSCIYRSHIQQLQKESPVVEFMIKDNNE